MVLKHIKDDTFFVYIMTIILALYFISGSKKYTCYGSTIVTYGSIVSFYRGTYSIFSIMPILFNIWHVWIVNTWTCFWPKLFSIMRFYILHVHVEFSSPRPNVNVRYCHHIVSVVRYCHHIVSVVRYCHHIVSVVVYVQFFFSEITE